MSTPHTATRITFHVYVASFGPNTQSMAAGFGVPYDVLNQPHLVYCQLILLMCRYNKHRKSLWSGCFMQFRSPGPLESRSSSTWGDRRLQVVFKPVCLATPPPTCSTADERSEPQKDELMLASWSLGPTECHSPRRMDVDGLQAIQERHKEEVYKHAVDWVCHIRDSLFFHCFTVKCWIEGKCFKVHLFPAH